MKKMAKFEKVSFEQFKKDWYDTFGDMYDSVEEFEKDVIDIYASIKLPKRATAKSAGYDFYCPIKVHMGNDGIIKIPTGIRCYIEDGWVLKMYPRSGHGFKYGVKLSNTVGIIDGDYVDADNEGHIFVKLVNDSVSARNFTIKQGDAFCQGVFTVYGITYDDDSTDKRTGGLGSTNK